MKNTPETFWMRVRKSDGCWLYIPPRSKKGIDYAQIHFEGKYWQIHRLAWYLSRGPIPNGLCVCHHCDNPQCVKPEHLFLGTIDDNNKDKARKGRAPSINHPRKLSDEQILEALRKHYDERAELSALSKEYGIGIRKLTLWFGRMREKYGIQKKSWTPHIDIEDAIKMRNDGMTLQELAKHFGVSRWKITDVLAKSQTGPTPARAEKV